MKLDDLMLDALVDEAGSPDVEALASSVDSMFGVQIVRVRSDNQEPLFLLGSRSQGKSSLATAMTAAAYPKLGTVLVGSKRTSVDAFAALHGAFASVFASVLLDSEAERDREFREFVIGRANPSYKARRYLRHKADRDREKYDQEMKRAKKRDQLRHQLERRSRPVHHDRYALSRRIERRPVGRTGKE